MSSSLSSLRRVRPDTQSPHARAMHRSPSILDGGKERHMPARHAPANATGRQHKHTSSHEGGAA